MYDILIVDDEYYICEGLASKIKQLNWPDLGEVRTCLSGEEALLICKTYKPQIVFTDIKMKEMDGIALIHALSRMLHPVQFFILSGYDDFEYVRGAFQKGAADYLLKPILNEDLQRVLASACTSLKNQPDTSERKRSEAFRFSHEVLRRLTSHRADSKSDSALLEDLASIGISKDCVLAILASDTLQSREVLTRKINQIYDGLDEYGAVVCNAISENKIGIITAASLSVQLQALLRSLLKPHTSLAAPSWAAAISELSPISSIVSLYRETEDLLCLRLQQGYGNLFSPANDRQKGKGLSEKLKHQVSSLLQTPSLILNDVQRITFYKEMRKMTLPDLKNFYVYFNEMLGISFINSHIAEPLPAAPYLYEFSSYEELEQFLYNRLTQYAAHLTLHTPGMNMLNVIRDYIDAHFAEDLSLSDLADRFFMSYSYLSKSFSRTFHMSFQEYLRMLRMEHAMELMKNPELNIQQIASLVGYDNAFNFSRAFKAQYGVSPSHFRNQGSR